MCTQSTSDLGELYYAAFYPHTSWKTLSVHEVTWPRNGSFLKSFLPLVNTCTHSLIHAYTVSCTHTYTHSLSTHTHTHSHTHSQVRYPLSSLLLGPGPSHQLGTCTSQFSEPSGLLDNQCRAASRGLKQPKQLRGTPAISSPGVLL